MKRRNVIIEGGRKKWRAPKVAVIQDGGPVAGAVPIIDDDFNFRSNRLRSPTDPIRWGHDYWPVHSVFARTGTGNIMQRIEVFPKPGGCDELWHILPAYGEIEEDPARVWAVTVRMQGGGLRDMFWRAGLRNITDFPFGTTQRVSMNIRPLDKIRFPAREYFIPEREFCYVGFLYV